MLIAEEFLLLVLDDGSGKRTMAGESGTGAGRGAGGRAGARRADRRSAPAIVRSATAGGSGSSTPRRPTIPSWTLCSECSTDARATKLTDLISPMSTGRISKGLPDRLIARLMAQRGADGRGPQGARPVPEADLPGPRPASRRRRSGAGSRRRWSAGETPTERTTALIALLSATNQVPKVVHGDKKALVARAKQLSDGRLGRQGGEGRHRGGLGHHRGDHSDHRGDQPWRPPDEAASVPPVAFIVPTRPQRPRSLVPR